MTPSTEPNSYGELNATEWRETYNAYVQEFKDSNRRTTDELTLRINLKRLGYVGTRLENELKYVKEGR